MYGGHSYHDVAFACRYHNFIALIHHNLHIDNDHHHGPDDDKYDHAGA